MREYERKRDFAKTAEPSARVPRASAQGSKKRFVVQKHAASHLHYDFRLEMHNVLKSWAIPKGVPYALDERRLAMATEDHPTEYLDFEGIIPEGQYGGGTVMVWDIGTYETVEGNYWKGNLEVSLKGKKLQGQWSLRRDRSKGETAWLLEKVGSAMKPTSASKDDRSALSGRTMAQIAHERDAVWQSNRASTFAVPEQKVQSRIETIDKSDLHDLPRSEPAYIEPMQAKLVDKLPEGENWEYEAKFDGYRVMIVKNTSADILSRRNNVLTAQFPTITAACAELEDRTVLDGEIIALDENGRPSFNALQNRRFHQHAMQLYAFDLLIYRGHTTGLRRMLRGPVEHARLMRKKSSGKPPKRSPTTRPIGAPEAWRTPWASARLVFDTFGRRTDKNSPRGSLEGQPRSAKLHRFSG